MSSPLNIVGDSSSLKSQYLDEISIWRGANFIDVSNGTKILQNLQKKNLSDNLFFIYDYILNNFQVENIIFLENEYAFDKIILDLHGEGIGYKSLFKQKYKSEVNSETSKTYTRNIPYNSYSLKKFNMNQKHECSLKIKENYVFEKSLYAKTDFFNIKYNGPDKIALLVPSYNFPFLNISELPLVKYFLPSIMNTTHFDDLKKITIYIGYDAGDSFFDLQQNATISYLLNVVKYQLNFSLVKLPRYNWLTLIWNVLFNFAYHDKNEYFFQLNDDLVFLDYGWINSTTSLLKPNSTGVVGLNDIRWDCKLYTQAVVSRNHFEIFNGMFYPLSIRNTFSDVWLTHVYGTFSFCEKNARVKNYNTKTRYSPCDDRNLVREIANGKMMIQKYLQSFGK